MTKQEFLKMMRFPDEWEAWRLYPDELFAVQLGEYEQGDEEASEHYRNGAFQWWLSRRPNAEALKQLSLLTDFDPDPLLAEDICRHIRRAEG